MKTSIFKDGGGVLFLYPYGIQKRDAKEGNQML